MFDPGPPSMERYSRHRHADRNTAERKAPRPGSTTVPRDETPVVAFLGFRGRDAAATRRRVAAVHPASPPYWVRKKSRPLDVPREDQDQVARMTGFHYRERPLLRGTIDWGTRNRRVRPVESVSRRQECLDARAWDHSALMRLCGSGRSGGEERSNRFDRPSRRHQRFST